MGPTPALSGLPPAPSRSHKPPTLAIHPPPPSQLAPPSTAPGALRPQPPKRRVQRHSNSVAGANDKAARRACAQPTMIPSPPSCSLLPAPASRAQRVCVCVCVCVDQGVCVCVCMRAREPRSPEIAAKIERGDLDEAGESHCRAQVTAPDLTPPPSTPLSAAVAKRKKRIRSPAREHRRERPTAARPQSAPKHHKPLGLAPPRGASALGAAATTKRKPAANSKTAV